MGKRSEPTVREVARTACRSDQLTVNTMLVFVDESGDTGVKFDRGSSSLFVIAMAIFADSVTADTAIQSVEQLRIELTFNSGVEFKFVKSSDVVRCKFLEMAATLPMFYSAIVVDKRRLPPEQVHNDRSLYGLALDHLFEGVRPHLENARVLLDERGGKGLTKAIQTRLKKLMNQSEIKRIQSMKSGKHRLLQVADMIAGAISHAYEPLNPHPKYINLIKARALVEVAVIPHG